MTVTILGGGGGGGGQVNDEFETSTAMTITLASLATSSTGLTGRQSTILQNTDGYPWVRLWIKLTQGTGPTSARGAYIYLLTGDGTYRTDGAGASDAAITVLNAQLVATGRNKASGAANGDIIYKECAVRLMAPEWGIAIAHDTGVNLDSTAGNHYVRYQYITGPA